MSSTVGYIYIYIYIWHKSHIINCNHYSSSCCCCGYFDCCATVIGDYLFSVSTFCTIVLVASIIFSWVLPFCHADFKLSCIK